MYKCPECGYESNKFFGLCPKCRNGIGEVVEEIQQTSIVSLSSKPKGKIELKRVDPNVKMQEAVRSTEFKDFNLILSTAKGFVEGQVILLGANPGVGKSTLCSQICNDNALYISSEESYQQVNSRMLRVNPKSNAEIFSSTNIDEIVEAITTTKSQLIIIDSLNAIEFGVGYQTTAKFAAIITETIKKLNKIGIIISQVGRTGEILGMNSVIHLVDTVMHMERSEISSFVIVTSSKNRYGEVGSVAVFDHTGTGLKEIQLMPDNKVSEIGSTLTTTKFGHKNMTISIESLVTSAIGSYGIKKSNGYNQNRLIQLVGMLQYYAKINLNDKDVYVNISNGLTTDDIGIELAMANSILSSYFNKASIIEAYGEISLNGKIRNGTIDGKPVKHLKELIEFYKGGN